MTINPLENNLAVYYITVYLSKHKWLMGEDPREDLRNNEILISTTILFLKLFETLVDLIQFTTFVDNPLELQDL